MNDFTNSLNKSFYFVTDKLIELQGFFIGMARNIAYVILLIAICSAAVNYALTGTGLKENVVKTLKAVVFYAVVLFIYPNIVSWITSYTFTLARDSTYAPMETVIKETQADIVDKAITQKGSNKKGTYGDTAVAKKGVAYFEGILNSRTFTSEEGDTTTYTTVAPIAVIRTLLLVAGECFNFSDKNSGVKGVGANLGKVFIGTFCGFFIVVVGAFALLEYLIAFIEFLFVSSVGIILFPFSLWDGSKFIAEKYIGAMLGFFIKLLLCSICIFLMLYGYLTLARQFSAEGFTGAIEQIVNILFSSLLYFYICKSAPGLAQSLLTGVPSLNAAGAIGAAAMATKAVIGGMAVGAGAGALGIMNTAGAIAQGTGAFSAAYGAAQEDGKSRGASIRSGLAAFGKSMRGSALDLIKDRGSELTRSLLGQSMGGHNRETHESAASKYGRTNADGSKRTMGQTFGEKRSAGKQNYKEAAAAKPAKAESK